MQVSFANLLSIVAAAFIAHGVVAIALPDSQGLHADHTEGHRLEPFGLSSLSSSEEFTPDYRRRRRSLSEFKPINRIPLLN